MLLFLIPPPLNQPGLMIHVINPLPTFLTIIGRILLAVLHLMAMISGIEAIIRDLTGIPLPVAHILLPANRVPIPQGFIIMKPRLLQQERWICLLIYPVQGIKNYPFIIPTYKQGIP